MNRFLFPEILKKIKQIVIKFPQLIFKNRKIKIKELKNGLTEQELNEKFNWILKAKIENAVLGKVGNKLIWYDGIWKDGVWEDGWWCGGIWEDGVFKNGWIRRPDGKFYKSNF